MEISRRAGTGLWVGEVRLSHVDLFICESIGVDGVGANEMVSAECGVGGESCV